MTENLRHSKVNECDFCQCESEHLNPVNDELWAICDACMDLHYRVLPRHLELKAAIRKCEHGVPFADCGCEEE